MSSPQRKLNPIEEHACLNEAIRKEMQFSRINETFTLNPNSLILLTDKPNKTALINLNENYEEGLTSDMKDKLYKVTAIPKMKNNFPATSNQEVGWDSDLPQYKPTWNYAKPSCAETKYASNYYTMTGRSPYSNKISENIKK
ncbi:hypothetical protein SteCoe_27304 [Stentor coeruleus]|uniref:Uncharacterized protein n=1 Tax=Stentor coeruleus TaxID=5963 RepID=A0A1R2BAX7_9CILI|nr:hypothetical protein SteCoe_27304 [Stentor coeruleus]